MVDFVLICLGLFFLLAICVLLRKPFAPPSKELQRTREQTRFFEDLH